MDIFPPPAPSKGGDKVQKKPPSKNLGAFEWLEIIYPLLAGELKGVENLEILIPPPAPSKRGRQNAEKTILLKLKVLSA